jgi:predicted DNA binding CopG/RHH family protein
MTKKTLEMPKFETEAEEADWWASPAGRAYVKRKSAAAAIKGTTAAGSSLVAKLNRKSSVQIAIRLPEADIKRAREIAGRKGIGYQTLLKMVVHEGLQREARRR